MKKIKLQYPVEADGQKIDELNMRRPKVRDMLNAETGGTDGEKEMRLFANLCDVAPDTIEQLDMADYLAVQEVYTGFLSSAQPTAGKPA